MIVTIILVLAVTIVAVMFALENPVMVTVAFYGYEVQGQVGLFVLIAFAVGVVLGILLMLPSLIGRSFANAHNRRRIAELEAKPKESKPKEDKPNTPAV
jgi:uncharacterized membrane protein YciS (DUF1049 family)